MYLLEVNDIHTGYGPSDVIHGVSLTVSQGEVVCLLGANGAGKSTILKTIAGVLPLRSGVVRFEERPITNLRPDQVDGLTLCPEGRRLFPEMTVLENIEIGAYRTWGYSQFSRRLEEIYQLFPKLRERSRQIASSLSGGEQQMVAIARALMSNPRLLLLDEPTLGLAPKVINEVGQLVLTLQEQGLSIIIVEQNARLALALSQRGYVIDTGRVALEGDSKNLQNDDRVQKIYLGA
ncbi:ABC transporter ATP-binding protein [Ochrobactrum teleogrylli]